MTTPTEDMADDNTKIIPIAGKSADAKAKSATKDKKKGKTKEVLN